MIKCKIVIGGPGGIASAPCDVIVEALEAAGATVTVVDEHGRDGEGPIQNKNQNPLKGWKCQIEVKHYPWGG